MGRQRKRENRKVQCCSGLGARMLLETWKGKTKAYCRAPASKRQTTKVVGRRKRKARGGGEPSGLGSCKPKEKKKKEKRIF